jgi:putative glutamine amidotransferase
MSTNASPLRIGIYGTEKAANQGGRGCGLWPPGYTAAVTAAGGTPFALALPKSGRGWEEFRTGVDGVVFLGSDSPDARHDAEQKRLCDWCRQQKVPLLAVDGGLHALNTAFGGTVHLDLAQELPQALQHRHPPEKGLRHAITVARGTRLAQLYGEGEIVVNSEHRRAVCRVAHGFRVSARALDGVIEAVETEAEGWFALGVQWQPASASASGLDIQLFRGLVEACTGRRQALPAAPRLVAA